MAPSNFKKTKFVLFTRSLAQVQSVINSDVLDQAIFLGQHKGETVVGLDRLEDIDPEYQKGGGWFAIQVSPTQAALLTTGYEGAATLENGPPRGKARLSHLLT